MKILLATDGTKHGKAAAKMLTRYDLGADDSIHVISVVDMAVPMAIDIYGGYLPDMAEMVAVFTMRARWMSNAAPSVRTIAAKEIMVVNRAGRRLANPVLGVEMVVTVRVCIMLEPCG